MIKLSEIHVKTSPTLTFCIIELFPRDNKIYYLQDYKICHNHTQPKTAENKIFLRREILCGKAF